jgi:hypothetical protein
VPRAQLAKVLTQAQYELCLDDTAVGLPSSRKLQVCSYRVAFVQYQQGLDLIVRNQSAMVLCNTGIRVMLVVLGEVNKKQWCLGAQASQSVQSSNCKSHATIAFQARDKQTTEEEHNKRGPSLQL